MKRRQFITLVGSAATWPLAARAQQPSGMRRIGVLVGNAESDAQTQVGLAKFSKALQDLGWIVGQQRDHSGCNLPKNITHPIGRSGPRDACGNAVIRSLLGGIASSDHHKTVACDP